MSLQDQGRARFRISVHLKRHHDNIFNLGLSLQRAFQVLGVYVHSRGRDDHILFASFEKQIAVGIELSNIAGVVPALVRSNRPKLIRTPVAGRDSAAAHQNFAVWR